MPEDRDKPVELTDLVIKPLQLKIPAAPMHVITDYGERAIFKGISVSSWEKKRLEEIEREYADWFNG